MQAQDTHNQFSNGQRVCMFVLALAISFSSIVAFGQSTKEELSALRSHLDLPEASPITLAPAPTFPKATPLKVFLAMGLDMKVRATFVEKIDEWNKKNGSKYGLVEVTDKLSSADLILARYTLQEKVSSRTGSYVTPASVYDAATGTWKSSPVSRTYSISSVPGYNYMIIPTANGYEIIWRSVGEASVGETSRSGRDLRNQFFDSMKNRK